MRNSKKKMTFMGVELTAEETVAYRSFVKNNDFGNIDERFRIAIGRVGDRPPIAESEREKQIFQNAHQMGFLFAMSQMPFWSKLILANYRPKATKTRTERAAIHRRVIARQYKNLCEGRKERDGVEDRRPMIDIDARRMLKEKHGHDLSYLTKILKKEGAI